MERTDAETTRRRRILLTLQVVRFVVAIVMFGLAIYFQDVLLAFLAVGFLILGTATTWLRLRDSERNKPS